MRDSAERRRGYLHKSLARAALPVLCDRDFNGTLANSRISLRATSVNRADERSRDPTCSGTRTPEPSRSGLDVIETLSQSIDDLAGDYIRAFRA